MTADTETIEHLREITIRQAERIERLESELIAEKSQSAFLLEAAMNGGRVERYIPDPEDIPTIRML